MELTFKEILDWFDNYYNLVIENKKVLRKKTFSGCRIEIHDKNHVDIIHEQDLEGVTEEEKLVSFVKKCFVDNRELILQYKTEDFIKVVRGEKLIEESDYFWSDEEWK